MQSKTNKVGFYLRQTSDTITIVLKLVSQLVLSQTDIDVQVQYTESFSDEERTTIASTMYASGVDVIYQTVAVLVPVPQEAAKEVNVKLDAEKAIRKAG